MSVPIGTIMAWPGPTSTIPYTDGWLPCNGGVVSRTQFPELCAVILRFWGRLDGDSYKLPDLRAMFLRGVNIDRQDGFTDPEFASRIVQGTDGSPNDVGSVQQDAFQQHQHAVGWRANVGGGNGPPVHKLHGPHDGFTDAAGTSTETRPNNAYIHWIIKARNAPIEVTEVSVEQEG